MVAQHQPLMNIYIHTTPYAEDCTMALHAGAIDPIEPCSHHFVCSYLLVTVLCVQLSIST